MSDTLVPTSKTKNFHALKSIADGAIVASKKAASIDRRLSLHEDWLDSDGRTGRQFLAWKEDFTGLDFQGRDLSRAEIRACTLHYCDFTNARFGESVTLKDCSLEHCVFHHTLFNKTNFIDCKISDCDFSDAELNGVLIECGHDIDGPPAKSGNRFDNAIIRAGRFVEVNFYGARLDRCSLDNVTFLKCDFLAASFTDAVIQTPLSFVDCRLAAADFRGKMLGTTRFTGCDLSGARFSDAFAQGATFDYSDLSDADFSETDLSYSSLIMVDALKTSFVGADLRNTCMRLSSLRQADLTSTVITHADLSVCDLLGAQIDASTHCYQTDFTGSTWIDGKRCDVGSIGHCVEVK